MIKFLVRQKFKFDIGQGLMQVLTYMFSIVAASDKISTLVHVSGTVILIIALPSATFIAWLIGHLADKYNYYKLYQSEMNDRNELLNELINNKK